MADFYRAEKVNDRVTAILSLTGEIMYLVNGSERSLLLIPVWEPETFGILWKNLRRNLLQYFLPMVTWIMQWELRNSPGTMEKKNVRST